MTSVSFAQPVQSGTSLGPLSGYLNLKEVQQEALKNSPSLQEGQARLRESRSKVDEAYTLVTPTLSLSGSATRITPPVEANLGGRPVVFTPEYAYSSAVSLRQTLLTFGRLHWAAASSELQEKAVEADLQERRLRVLEEAAVVYYETLLSQAQVQIAEDQLKASQAHLQESRNLVKAGSAAPFDVKRNEALLANSQQQLLEAQTRAGLSRLRLYTLLQRPDQGERLEPAPADLPRPPLGDEVEKALARRHDLSASRFGVEAARARIELAEAQDNPSLGLQSDYINRTQTSFAPGSQWSVGLNLQIPLFDGGLTQARSQQAREIVEQLQALYEGSRRNALLEINGLQLELRNRFQRLEVAQRNLDSAQEAARIARLRYQNGLSTNVELLDSEAALTAAQNDTVASRYQYLQSLARYQRAAALEEGSP